MKSPRLPTDYPDRHLECQEAFEPHVITLIDEGMAAGWSTRDITTALVVLADNLMLADEANKQTDLDIRDALRRMCL